MQARLLMAEREMTRRSQVVAGLKAEPRFQHPADAEALILTSEEAPRALQPKPELHKAFLIILDLHHTHVYELQHCNTATNFCLYSSVLQ